MTLAVPDGQGSHDHTRELARMRGAQTGLQARLLGGYLQKPRMRSSAEHLLTGATDALAFLLRHERISRDVGG